MSKPWHRQKTDTDAAFAAFRVYLEMGSKRSLSKVVEALGKSRGYDRVLGRWSSAHDWVERCRAYDDHEWDQKLAGREQAREKVRQRALDAAMTRIDELEAIAAGDGKFAESGAPASGDQLKAIEKLLSLAGVTPPGRVELTGKDGAPLVPASDTRPDLRDLLDDDEARAALRVLASKRSATRGE